MVRFLRVLGALPILAMAAAAVEPAAHEGVAPESLCPTECRVVRISGADKLCLFNCFARDTEWSATALRRVVCELMHADKDMVMADDGTTVREFLQRESSTFESLTEANVAREGAGLAVVGSLAQMLRRNVRVYQLAKVGEGLAYVLIHQLTVDATASALLLLFTRGGSIGHYDVLEIEDGRHAHDTQARCVENVSWTLVGPRAAKRAKAAEMKPPTRPTAKRAPAKSGAGAMRRHKRAPTCAGVFRNHEDDDEEVRRSPLSRAGCHVYGALHASYSTMTSGWASATLRTLA